MIDSNLYFQDNIPGRNIAAIISSLHALVDDSSQEGIIAIQTNEVEEETLYLSDLAIHSSLIKGVVGWVDLLSDELPEKLDLLRKHPSIKGFRNVVHDKQDKDFMLHPGFIRGINKLQDT